jgi:pSer/pThr/pTyr-binding forkhead associated (FHA) protein
MRKIKVRLVGLNPWTETRKAALNGPVMVGRSPDADIHLADCWASRRHCQIDQINGTLVVRDIGSRHGTFVNGERVSQAHLLPGARLTVGLSSFEVQYQRDGESEAEHPYAAVCEC